MNIPTTPLGSNIPLEPLILVKSKENKIASEVEAFVGNKFDQLLDKMIALLPFGLGNLYIDYKADQLRELANRESSVMTDISLRIQKAPTDRILDGIARDPKSLTPLFEKALFHLESLGERGKQALDDSKNGKSIKTLYSFIDVTEKGRSQEISAQKVKIHEAQVESEQKQRQAAIEREEAQMQARADQDVRATEYISKFEGRIKEKNPASFEWDLTTTSPNLHHSNLDNAVLGEIKFGKEITTRLCWNKNKQELWVETYEQTISSKCKTIMSDSMDSYGPDVPPMRTDVKYEDSVVGEKKLTETIPFAQANPLWKKDNAELIARFERAYLEPKNKV